MERFYIGTTVILLVSSVAAWYKVEKEKETSRLLRKSINRLEFDIACNKVVIELYKRQSKELNEDKPESWKVEWEGTVVTGSNKLSVMINREYELLENADSISRVTKGDIIKVTAQFDKELEHKHVYDTEAKVLYEIVEVEEHSMRGRDTDYTYELKKVS